MADSVCVLRNHECYRDIDMYIMQFLDRHYHEGKDRKKQINNINNKITQHHPKNPLRASLLSNSCKSERIKNIRYLYLII